MDDTLRKIFLVGVGAIATTADKSKEIIEDLVKKGEITVEQGKVLNDELKHKVSEKINKVTSVKVEEMSKEERDALRAQLDAIDQAEEADE